MTDPLVLPGPDPAPRVAHVVEGGPLMRMPILRAAEMLAPGLGGFVVVTVRDDDELTSRLAERDTTHYSLRCRTARDYPRAVARLARLLDRDSIDVVHGVEPIAGVIANAASIVARRAGRLYDRQHSKATRPGRVMSLLAARTAHLIRVPSQAALAWTVAEDRVAADRVRVIYNPAAEPRPVPTRALLQLRASLGIGPDDHVVCSVARLRSEKRLDVGIAARRELESQLSQPIHYVIVGDGPDRATLEAKAGGDRYVHFVGNQDDIWPWYEAADLAWMPSANESFGIAAAEAMATGTPVIASRVGGLVEILEGERGGRLVPPGSPRALARATRELIESPEILERASRDARDRYDDEFTPARVALETQAAYADLGGSSRTLNPRLRSGAQRAAR